MVASKQANVSTHCIDVLETLGNYSPKLVSWCSVTVPVSRLCLTAIVGQGHFGSKSLELFTKEV